MYRARSKPPARRPGVEPRVNPAEMAEASRLMITTKTYMARPGQLEAKWWLVDASGKVLGRLASEIAMILMGKHRPTYTPHVDTGDYVVVVNVDKLVLTGKKLEQKQYTWYTGYPGLRTETAGHRLARKPEKVLSDAVRRMLPKNKLATQMLQKMKMYAGDQHPHQAQQPEPIELGLTKQAKKDKKEEKKQ
jgi:large subunit ribosomal protein L13